MTADVPKDSGVYNKLGNTALRCKWDGWRERRGSRFADRVRLSRVRNFSGRVVARSCSIMHAAQYSLCDAAASPGRSHTS